jgi:hypothetical protein
MESGNLHFLPTAGAQIRNIRFFIVITLATLYNQMGSHTAGSCVIIYSSSLFYMGLVSFGSLYLNLIRSDLFVRDSFFPL